MPKKIHALSSMRTNVFLQFIFRVIIARIAAIRGHMTTTVGVVTKDHVLLLGFKSERYSSRYMEDMKLLHFCW